MPKDSYFTLIPPPFLFRFPRGVVSSFSASDDMWQQCGTVVIVAGSCFAVTPPQHSPPGISGGQWLSAQLGVIFNKYVRFSASVFPFSYAPPRPWALWYIIHPKNTAHEWVMSDWMGLTNERTECWSATVSWHENVWHSRRWVRGFCLISQRNLLATEIYLENSSVQRSFSTGNIRIVDKILQVGSPY